MSSPDPWFQSFSHPLCVLMITHQQVSGSKRGALAKFLRDLVVGGNIIQRLDRAMNRIGNISQFAAPNLGIGHPDQLAAFIDFHGHVLFDSFTSDRHPNTHRKCAWTEREQQTRLRQRFYFTRVVARPWC